MAGVNGVQESNNTGLYAGAIGTGAVAGGAGAYYLTKAIKENEATDKFVKYVAEGLEDNAKAKFDALTKVKPELTTYLDELKDAAKTPVPTEAEALTTFKNGRVDKLKGYGIEGESVTKGLENVTNAETLKTFAETTAAEAATTSQKSYLNGLIKDGKFSAEGLEGDAKVVAEAVAKKASSFKYWAAAKWAAIGAAVLGVAAYAYKKCSGNPAGQPVEKA